MFPLCCEVKNHHLQSHSVTNLKYLVWCTAGIENTRSMHCHALSPHQPQQTSLIYPVVLSVLETNCSLRHVAQPQTPVQHCIQGSHEQCGIPLERPIHWWSQTWAIDSGLPLRNCRAPVSHSFNFSIVCFYSENISVKI